MSGKLQCTSLSILFLLFNQLVFFFVVSCELWSTVQLQYNISLGTKILQRYFESNVMLRVNLIGTYGEGKTFFNVITGGSVKPRYIILGFHCTTNCMGTWLGKTRTVLMTIHSFP
jgi:hypothetical protein